MVTLETEADSVLNIERHRICTGMYRAGNTTKNTKG